MIHVCFGVVWLFSIDDSICKKGKKTILNYIINSHTCYLYRQISIFDALKYLIFITWQNLTMENIYYSFQYLLKMNWWHVLCYVFFNGFKKVKKTYTVINKILRLRGGAGGAADTDSDDSDSDYVPPSSDDDSDGDDGCCGTREAQNKYNKKRMRAVEDLGELFDYIPLGYNTTCWSMDVRYPWNYTIDMNNSKRTEIWNSVKAKVKTKRTNSRETAQQMSDESTDDFHVYSWGMHFLFLNFKEKKLLFKIIHYLQNLNDESLSGSFKTNFGDSNLSNQLAGSSVVRNNSDTTNSGNDNAGTRIDSIGPK